MTDQIEMAVGEAQPEQVAHAHMLCGCRHTITPDSCYITAEDQCEECRFVSGNIEEKVGHHLDYELDHYVQAAAGGKRVQRIGPADPFKGARAR